MHRTNKKSGKRHEDDESEGLALLIPDIQETARIVGAATSRAKSHSEEEQREEGWKVDLRGAVLSDADADQRYMDIMRKQQFGTLPLSYCSYLLKLPRNMRYSEDNFVEANRAFF